MKTDADQRHLEWVLGTDNDNLLSARRFHISVPSQYPLTFKEEARILCLRCSQMTEPRKWRVLSMSIA